MAKKSIKLLFLLRQSDRIFLHELKRKKRRKELRLRNLPDKIKNYRTQKFIKNPKKARFNTYKAPDNFSLIDVPSTVVDFFSNAKKSLKSGTPIFFDLSSINNMGTETLTYICALLNDESYTEKVPIRGNAPKDEKLNLMFNKAGFYEFVTPDYPHNQVEDRNGKLINRIVHEKVKPKLAAEVVTSAIKHTYSNESFVIKSQNSYIFLIECMANTKNHANYGDINEVYNWWLLAYKEPISKITKFCFLDLGIGIFGSLTKKYVEKNLTSILKSIVAPNDNKKTLLNIFKGSKKTSTDLPGRGLGLYNIYSRVKNDKNIKGFTIISNDVMAKIEYNTSDKVERMNCNFNGTLFYWELIP
jgi:hypothetical protein